MDLTPTGIDGEEPDAQAADQPEALRRIGGSMGSGLGQK